MMMIQGGGSASNGAQGGCCGDMGLCFGHTYAASHKIQAPAAL